MKKLLFLMVLINHFFLDGMQSIKAFLECGLGLSYRCGPIAKMPSSKFDGIPWGVQSKIVKNIFLLTLHDNKCTYECTCDMHADCSLCSMHWGNSSKCKQFRLNLFDREKLEKHTFTNVPVKLGLQYIKEFLDAVHVHNTQILGNKFDFKTMYSIPHQHRHIIWRVQSPFIFFHGYTQEEYKTLKKIPALKGRELMVEPESLKFILWKRFHSIAIGCAFCAAPITLLTMKSWPTVSSISFIFLAVGGGTYIGNALMLKKCREDDPESWKLKKVIL